MVSFNSKLPGFYRVISVDFRLGFASQKDVRGVFDEVQAEHQVLVFGNNLIGAKLVGRCPKGLCFNLVEHFSFCFLNISSKFDRDGQCDTEPWFYRLI